MSPSAAEMPPVAFYTEQSLRSALAAIKKAVEDSLDQGNASARMADVELQFLRVVANEKANILRSVLHESQYDLVWHFLWEWHEFKQTPNCTEAEFLGQQRQITAESKLWIPKPAPAPPAPPQTSRRRPTTASSAGHSSAPVKAPPQPESSKAAAHRIVQLSTSPPLEHKTGKRLFVGIPPPPRIANLPPADISQRTVYIERRPKEGKGAKQPKEVVPFHDVNDTDNEYAPPEDKKRKRTKGDAPTKPKPKKSKKQEPSADEMDVDDDAEADETREGDTKRVRTAPRAVPKMTAEVFKTPCERCRKSVPPLVCQMRVLHSKNAKIGACFFCSQNKVACKGRSDNVRPETAAETQARLGANGAEQRPPAPQPSTSKFKSRHVIEDESDLEIVPPKPVKTGPPQKAKLPSELLADLRGNNATVVEKPRSKAGPASKVNPPRPLPVPTGRKANNSAQHPSQKNVAPPLPTSHIPPTAVESRTTKPPTEPVTKDADADTTPDADTTHDTEKTVDVDITPDVEAEATTPTAAPDAERTTSAGDADNDDTVPTPDHSSDTAPAELAPALLEALRLMYTPTETGVENPLEAYVDEFIGAIGERFAALEQRIANVDRIVRDSHRLQKTRLEVLQETLDKVGPMLLASLHDMEAEAGRLQHGTTAGSTASNRRPPHTFTSNVPARSASAPPTAHSSSRLPLVQITPATPHSSQPMGAAGLDTQKKEHRQDPPAVVAPSTDNSQAQRTEDVEMGLELPTNEVSVSASAPANTAVASGTEQGDPASDISKDIGTGLVGMAPIPSTATSDTTSPTASAGNSAPMGTTPTTSIQDSSADVQNLKPPRTPSRRSASPTSRSNSPIRRSPRLVSYSRSPSPRRAGDQMDLDH